MSDSRNGASPDVPVAGRWDGIERPYTDEQVQRLRGPVHVEHTLARLGSERLWELLCADEPVSALGALTGGQAVQMAKAGLDAIYLSGWQVAADANLAGQTYPDQSLYPADSAPALVRRLNNALIRAIQVEAVEGNEADWLLPIVADAEAGFGGPLQAATWVGKCSFRRASSCVRSPQPASRPTSPASRRCSSLGRTR